jgi:low temperature requirement protein LtrA
LTSPDPTDDVRVSTLELFFDLVFVFTITQLTSVLAHHPDAGGLIRVLLLLVVIWWMYGGYAWLTNLVAPDRFSYQLLLLGGMAAFFVLSLAVPSAFSGGGTAFGIAYLVAVSIHAGLFTRSQRGASATAILRVAPLNLAAAIAILAAGVAGGPARWVLWGVATAVILLPSLRAADPRFELAPRHFVERHGLVVIVALGESVVAAGIGARGHELTVGLTLAALLGLALSACLWWTSFGRDEDARALAAMVRASRAQRARLALLAFYHWYLLMLLGIIAAASSLQRAIGRPYAGLSTAHALALGGGVACFMAGNALFRRTLGIGSQRWRLLAGVLALASVPIGHAASAVAQLGTLVAALLVSLAAEARLTEEAEASGQLAGSGEAVVD